ncbi:MAG: hypothetical protein ACP5R4_03045 [Armatimonadota bacterium]
MNGDGKVNIVDVTSALRIALGIQSASPDEMSAADVASKSGVGAGEREGCCALPIPG